MIQGYKEILKRCFQVYVSTVVEFNRIPNKGVVAFAGDNDGYYTMFKLDGDKYVIKQYLYFKDPHRLYYVDGTEQIVYDYQNVLYWMDKPKQHYPKIFDKILDYMFNIKNEIFCSFMVAFDHNLNLIKIGTHERNVHVLLTKPLVPINNYKHILFADDPELNEKIKAFLPV